MRIPARNLPVLVLSLCVAGGLTGCAGLRTFFFPTPPPPGREAAPPAAVAPAAPREAAPPSPPPKERVSPPVLSPQVGAGDEERLKRQSAGRIEETEQIIKGLDQKRLTRDQQDTYATILSFLTGARQALATQDFLRASNLADKAHVLAEGLSQSLR